MEITDSKLLQNIEEAYPLGMPVDGVAVANIVLICLRQHDKRIAEMRRDLDNIKVRSYELGQKELHNMALDALVRHK